MALSFLNICSGRDVQNDRGACPAHFRLLLAGRVWKKVVRGAVRHQHQEVVHSLRRCPSLRALRLCG